MTRSEAKGIIKTELEKRNLPFTRLTARTVDFSDLERSAGIFVRVHGWQPNSQWNELKSVAKANGFCLES